MGADLYIRKYSEPAKQEWKPKFDAAVERRNRATDDTSVAEAQKLVDEAYNNMYPEAGYFRDSYNGTGILGRIGLSWWRDLEPDIDPETNPDGNNVSAEACRAFVKKILDAGELEPVTEESLRADHCTVDDGANSVETWNKFYQEKRTRLIAFFERAAEAGGMYASC